MTTMKQKADQTALRKPGSGVVKVTELVVDEIAQMQAKGMTRKQACHLAGIKEDTFNHALMRSARYREIMDLRQAALMDRLLDQILSGGLRWQSAAWMLERRWPKQWGRQAAEVQVTNAITVGLTMEQAELLRAAAKRLPLAGAKLEGES